MDTKTRAEKIANNWMNHPANIEALTEEITSQLDEAVALAKSETRQIVHEVYFDEGFAAAKKKAAGICYLAGHKIQGLRGDLRGPFAFHLGESIRNMSETSMEA